LKLCEKNRPGQDILTPALIRGGVHFGIPGSRREEIFGEVLNFLPLPGHIDRSSLKEMLISREQSGTTGIGNGIAIPHVKHPVIFAGLDPVVGLFFLDVPVDFAALDGEPVHTLFVILSGSFKGHLSLLSRLAFCLQEKNVKAALDRRANAEEILATFQVAEAKTVRTP
jgi:PTS system nitrogen regulatory IIA component